MGYESLHFFLEPPAARTSDRTSYTRSCRHRRLTISSPRARFIGDSVLQLVRRSYSSVGSITRATSLPHFLQVPRNTRDRPLISPSRSSKGKPIRHWEHHTSSTISFLAHAGTCSHRFFAAGVNFGKGMVFSSSLARYRSKSSLALKKPSSVIPTDFALPIGFNRYPFS